MRRAVLLVTMVGATLLAFGGVVLAQQQGGGAPPRTPTDKIPDTYIVVFDEGAVGDPRAVANEHAQANGLRLKHVYRRAIEGYAAVFPNEQSRQRVENDPRVDYVEQDGVVNAAAQTQPWGVDKIEAQKSSTLAGNGSGSVSNVRAYVIDSGIYTAHRDLKVVNHVNFAGGENKDCNGHGTHVAGTVAAKDDTNDVVGVAPGADLYGVKVLGCNNTGSWSGVIAGVDWVTANATLPAVANMSLSGGASQAVDDAVRKSAKPISQGGGGVFYALAAGNDGANACNYSPARAGRTQNADGTWNKNNGVMTVAATDKLDAETSFSNWGNCVDIWAPGASILSTKMGGGTTTMSGTSMASPHGAGGGALYLSKNTGSSPSAVEGPLKSAATTTTNKSKDPNRVTYIVRERVSTF
jgi:subtilisin family serine protease